MSQPDFARIRIAPSYASSPAATQAHLVLRQLRRALSADAAILCFLARPDEIHVPFAISGYSRSLVEFLCTTFVQDDPTFAMLRGDAQRSYSWADVPGFDESDSALAHFRPAGFNEGCSVPLFDSLGRYVGTCHVSVREPEFPRHGAAVLELLRPTLSGLAEGVQRQAQAWITRRELDVIRLVAAGQSNVEIAAALQVTLSTVRRHLEHVFDKIGVDNRVSVTTAAIGMGLVQAPAASAVLRADSAG